jgi:predicted DCC family thiol-disulfide oxidoreductase YuxK
MLSVSSVVNPEMAARTIVVVDDAEFVYYGAQAIFILVSVTGGLTGILGKSCRNRFVSRVLEPFYRIFAKNRGRIAYLFRDPH